DCQRGGYPKVGVGSDLFATSKAWKCTLCNGVAGAEADMVAAYGEPNPTRASSAAVIAVPEKKHEPTCVYTCPAKAMKWETRDAIVGAGGILASGGYLSYQGDGSMFWASKKYIIAAPKADPFVEDHITPMLSSMLTDSVSKATVVPTLVAGGIIAVIARRIRLANGEG
ncbi:MAG: hypothetical protein Q8K89_06365, partial [Actinomycetota bacterium]|nr:hypothetical protein [Actinomycetota bacterium]